MALRNRLSPTSNNNRNLGTNAEAVEESIQLLTEAEIKEHQVESNMVSSYWLYSPQPKQSKSRHSFSDLSAEVLCADAEAARATAAAAQAKADLAKATAKAAQASNANNFSSPCKENVATQNFSPNIKSSYDLSSPSKSKKSSSNSTKLKHALKTNESVNTDNSNQDLVPKRVFSPIADDKGDSNSYAVLFPYQSADAPLGITIAMRVAPSADGGPVKKLAVVSMNPKGLPVEVGDVITHVGDEPLPHAMPDPLRLVTSLVRSKRAQGRDVVIFFKRAAAAPALFTPPPKKASNKSARRNSNATNNQAKTGTAPSPLKVMSSPRATGGLHFSRRAKPSPARAPLGNVKGLSNVEAVPSALDSCMDKDRDMKTKTLASDTDHSDSLSLNTENETTRADEDQKAEAEGARTSSTTQEDKKEEESAPSSSSLEQLMEKYKAHHAHLENHIQALESAESAATSADFAAAATREELLAESKASEDKAAASHAALLSDFEASRAAAEGEKTSLEAHWARQEALMIEDRAALEQKMALASQAYQEERAAAEAAFEAHAEAAAKDRVQLMEGPLTAGLGDEGRRELTQAHEEELAVAASERVLVLAEIDAVARRKAQDTENKVLELSGRIADLAADRELLLSTHAAFQEASEHDRATLIASFDETKAQHATHLAKALDEHDTAAAEQLKSQNQEDATVVEAVVEEKKSEQEHEHETISTVVQEKKSEQEHEHETISTVVENEGEMAPKMSNASPEQETTLTEKATTMATLPMNSTPMLLKCAAVLVTVAGGMAGMIIACHALLRGLNTKPESAVARSFSSSQLSRSTTFEDQAAIAYPAVTSNIVYSAVKWHLTSDTSLNFDDVTTSPLPNLLALPAPLSHLNHSLVIMAAANYETQAGHFNEEDEALESLYWEWLKPLPPLAAEGPEIEEELWEEPIIGEWLAHEEGNEMEIQYTGAYSESANDLGRDERQNEVNDALVNLYWEWLEPLPVSKWVHEDEPIIGEWLAHGEEEVKSGEEEEAGEFEEDEPVIGEWLVNDEVYEEEAAVSHANLVGPYSAIEFGLELTFYAPVSATIPPALFWSPQAKQSRSGWTQRKAPHALDAPL